MPAQTEPEEDWAELPLFAPPGTKIPSDTSAQTPAVGALSHLLYDDDTPEEASELLREQGNRSFKLGTHGYKRAIAQYTSAIAAAAGSRAAVPAYLNRATAHSRLGNHGYALADAEAALRLDAGNVKACYRAAFSLRALRRHEEAVRFCDAGESAGGDATIFAGVRAEARARLAGERLRDVAERAAAEAAERVQRMLRERGVRIGAPLFEMQTRYASTGARWEDGWRWPVLVVYVGDEVERSDYLEDVDEEACMGDVLETVLAERPAWDRAGLYGEVEGVEMRFRRDWTVVAEDEDVVGSEVCEPGEWVTVGRDVTLREVLGWEKYVTPLFPVFYAVPSWWG